ncbi:MAG TPA: TolC family protein [Planktothrix sp.]|jgi:outer membrane protein TolC
MLSCALVLLPLTDATAFANDSTTSRAQTSVATPAAAQTPVQSGAADTGSGAAPLSVAADKLPSSAKEVAPLPISSRSKPSPTGLLSAGSSWLNNASGPIQTPLIPLSSTPVLSKVMECNTPTEFAQSAPSTNKVSHQLLEEVPAPGEEVPLAPIRLSDASTNPLSVTAPVANPPQTGANIGQTPLTTDTNTLQLNPLYLSRSIEMNSFDALRHETTLDQMITLRDAIKYVLDQGMQIKVSRESMNYQHWLTLSGLASFLPSFSMSYTLTRADVVNFETTSNAHTFLTGVSFPVFQGGGVLYSLLSQRYREMAWRDAYKATVSDVFLDVYQKYTNVILQRVLLQTWGKSVEADEEQLRINKAQLQYGTGTRYAVMQAEAQLALDRQSFLQQAVAMRQAGLALNLALNCPLSINLIPAEQTLVEAQLFKDNVQLRSLIQDTIKFNPGLRQYENFRLSAARNIQAQAASLYPTVSFFALYQLNSAGVNPPANGFALGGAATSAIASFLDSSFAGRVSNNALGQLYGFSPTAGSTSSQGANTAPSALPAASGGTPLSAVQSGSLVSSGAVAPSIFGGGTGSSSGPNTNGSLQAPAGIFPGFFSEVQTGFQLNWSLPNMGVTTVTTLLASKVLARQAMMQCNQEITLVVEQIRSDYLQVLSTRQAIDKAAASAASFREALKYAKARLDAGVGTQLDLIQAQRDYITSLTAQGQAIVSSNVAQAQLLHDMGIISESTLTNGYKPGVFSFPIPTGRHKWYKP